MIRRVRVVLEPTRARTHNAYVSPPFPDAPPLPLTHSLTHTLTHSLLTCRHDNTYTFSPVRASLSQKAMAVVATARRRLDATTMEVPGRRAWFDGRAGATLFESK